MVTSKSPVRPGKSRGFTLIELIVVLSIVALLVTIAAPRYFRSVEKTKETVLRSNLAATRDALDKFYGDLGRYPNSLEELVERKYLRAMPFDPIVDSSTAWLVQPPRNADGSVGNLSSSATGKGIDGTDYRDW